MDTFEEFISQVKGVVNANQLHVTDEDLMKMNTTDLLEMISGVETQHPVELFSVPGHRMFGIIIKTINESNAVLAKEGGLYFYHESDNEITDNISDLDVPLFGYRQLGEYHLKQIIPKVTTQNRSTVLSGGFCQFIPRDADKPNSFGDWLLQ